jgi:hypothetical protein
MVFGVAKVHEMLVVPIQVAHALWVMKACLVETAIHQAHFGTTYSRHAFSSLLINQYQAVVARV